MTIPTAVPFNPAAPAAVPFNPASPADNPAYARGYLPVPDSELHIVPDLRNYFRPNMGRLNELHLDFFGLSKQSKPSGWLSPSVHPTLPLRQLVLYLMDPDAWTPAQFPEETQTSMLMGTIFHEIVNFAFEDMGVAVKPEGKTCPLCGRPRGRKLGADTCNEHPVIDKVLKRRGHIDNVLDLPRLGVIPMDLKTCAPHALKSINNHDPSIFTDNPTPLKAKYYAQAQQYIDLYNAQQFLFLFMSLGYPWELREVVIERDQAHIDAVAEKYRTARRLASLRQVPEQACCNGAGEVFRSCQASSCAVKRFGAR